MTATINASTSSGIVQTADTSGALALQSNGTTKLTVDSTGAYGQLVSGTAVASTSGTSIDFTSIPSWVKRVTVMFQGVSTNGTSAYLIQIGSGSVTTTGYGGASSNLGSASLTTSNYTTGFGINEGSAARTNQGAMSILLLSGSTYVASGVFSQSSTTNTYLVGGQVTLGGVLDRVRITTVNGTDTFDAGSINILYEG